MPDHSELTPDRVALLRAMRDAGGHDALMSIDAEEAAVGLRDQGMARVAFLDGVPWTADITLAGAVALAVAEGMTAEDRITLWRNLDEADHYLLHACQGMGLPADVAKALRHDLHAAIRAATPPARVGEG